MSFYIRKLILLIGVNNIDNKYKVNIFLKYIKAKYFYVAMQFFKTNFPIIVLLIVLCIIL